ncbi:hypothetical protein J0H58_30285 [bacterium]|nr:hypothetical protein [bacterium]
MIRVTGVLAATAVVGAVWAAPLPVTDPFLPGTRWQGELTQKGVFGGGAVGPPAFRAVLTVTVRDGDRFEADLAERSEELQVTYHVKGMIVPGADGKGFAVRFRSTGASGAVNTAPILGVHYDGVLTGRTVRGAWRVPTNPEGTSVEGGFRLELAK